MIALGDSVVPIYAFDLTHRGKAPKKKSPWRIAALPQKRGTLKGCVFRWMLINWVFPSSAQKEKQLEFIDLDGAPGMTRTCDLLVRSQTLYPTELRALRR